MSEVARVLEEVGGKSQALYSRLGLWPARVEDEDDPRKLGRVRVRVFVLHGDKRATPTADLPWARVLSFGGGGKDFGSAGRSYPAGATVMVAFEQGDERLPIVVGGVHGDRLRDDLNPIEFLTVDGRSYNEVEQTWLPDEGNEVPQDVFADSADQDTHPTRTVWAKSYKGHTILVEDRDGSEFLKIIDRAGQVIEMNCPVTVENNSNNVQQRGARNASNDSQLSQDVLVNQKAFIRIKDVGGQELVLDGSGGNEKIVIHSRNRQGVSNQKITLSSAKGREFIELVDKQGTRVTLNPNNPNESIVLQDYVGNKVAFNPETGTLEFLASTGESHNTGKYEGVFSQGREVTVGGEDKATVLSNKVVEVMNNFSSSIAGLSNMVFGGAIQAAIANAPPGGAPATTALQLEIATGGFSLSTLLGDLDISTLAGNANFGSTAGNLNVQTAVGTANIGSLVGETKLGGATAAFYLARAENIAAALQLIATTGAADVRIVMGIPVPPVTWPTLVASLVPYTTPGIPTSIYSLLGAQGSKTV